MKALVAGWFSFEGMGATAGDLLARDVVCEWLDRAGCAHDVATAMPFTDGVDWRSADPAAYTHLVFVCGPCGDGWPLTELLSRFAGRRLIGVNLSMLEPLEAWNPFALLLERDSSRGGRPDLAFLSDQPRAPVVGVVLIHPQPEYGARDLHGPANAAIRRLAASREMAAVTIDTRLDVNSTGLRTPAEIESLIAHMDVVLTTRLHGLVLALRNGVPAVAVDPVEGGAKIRKQAEAIGWPAVLASEGLTQKRLEEAYEYCLTPAARAAAIQCRDRARQLLAETRAEFLAGLAAPADR